MRLAQFIEANRVKMEAAMIDSRPDGLMDMPHGSTHWRCVLRRGRRQMTVYFSQGPAICKEPSAVDVLNCLASDAAGYENARSFEEWCGEYGYDTDSRKAERIYCAIEKQAGALALLLDVEQYEQLLWKMERE